MNTVVLTHSKAFSLACLFLAFQPGLPFQVVHFVLFTVPRAVCTGFLNCLGFGSEGVRESKLFMFCRLNEMNCAGD